MASRENQENREEVQEEVERATDEDARQFIDYMIERSHRLKEMLDRKGIHHEQAFYQKHLINSVCLVPPHSLRKPSSSRCWTR